MAKLTDKQINSVAFKIQLELSKIASKKSLEYNKLLEQDEDFVKKITTLRGVLNDIEELTESNKKGIIDNVTSNVLFPKKKFFTVPNAQEIYHNLVIQSITDEDFNIESLIEQFKIQYNL